VETRRTPGLSIIAGVTPEQQLIIAVEHPSLHGLLGVFLEELRNERGCNRVGPNRGRSPYPELIDRLGAPAMMRLGVLHGGRLIAVAAVDNDGAVALAVSAEFRRRGIANDLIDVLTERAAAIGYPPLHRYTPSRARLAG
jgi:ribosomal protein S18 acetylase RimI-like enzyme